MAAAWVTVPLQETDWNRCREVIETGGLLIYPTESFYALGCSAWSASAVNRVLELKSRGPEQGVPLIVAEEAQILAEIDTPPPRMRELARQFWPGPLSLVVALSAHTRIVAGVAVAGTVAVRVSGEAVARRLAHVPLVATSANPPGAAPAVTAESVDQDLVARVDLVVAGVICPGGKPSTLLDLTGEEPRILRHGGLSAKALGAVRDTVGD